MSLLQLRFKRSVLFFVAASLLTNTAAPEEFCPSGSRVKNNPAVMPVNSNPHGASYGEWAARWWQWEFSLPTTGNPIFDTADCNAGQTGKVWFLGGRLCSEYYARARNKRGHTDKKLLGSSRHVPVFADHKYGMFDGAWRQRGRCHTGRVAGLCHRRTSNHQLFT